MKLYATTTSERASKGQGGNDYLQIEITDGEKNILGIINVMPKPDGAIAVLPVIQATFDDRLVVIKSIDTNYRFSDNNWKIKNPILDLDVITAKEAERKAKELSRMIDERALELLKERLQKGNNQKGECSATAWSKTCKGCEFCKRTPGQD